MAKSIYYSKQEFFIMSQKYIHEAHINETNVTQQKFLDKQITTQISITTIAGDKNDHTTI